MRIEERSIGVVCPHGDKLEVIVAMRAGRPWQWWQMEDCRFGTCGELSIDRERLETLMEEEEEVAAR